MLNTAIKAARTAGAIINRASLDLERVQVNSKAPNDFVTEVDHAAEAAIIDTLLAAYPGHGILAEESGSTRGAKDSDYVWIIDPLDGTTNFIHGLPTYAVSIGLSFRGQVQQAVVYDPARNDLFYATRGRGAYLNDKRLRVAARKELKTCLSATGIPFMGRGTPQDHERFLKELRAVIESTPGVRRFGSAALDLAWVAAGRYDAFWEHGLAIWDIAAGILMVREAQGLVTDLNGGERMLQSGDILVANEYLHPQVLKLLRSAARAGSAV